MPYDTLQSINVMLLLLTVEGSVMIETRGVMAWERRGKKSNTVFAKVRKELGINQTEFAKLCGIGSIQMVSQYEAGRTLPKLEVVMRVIEVARKNSIDITLEDFGGKYRG